MSFSNTYISILRRQPQRRNSSPPTSNMATLPESLIDSEEGIFLDSSTAPTTPDGSLSFSPVLQATRSSDNLDDDFSGSYPPIFRSNSRSLSTAILENSTQARPLTVRNICCVGAGYVGKSQASIMMQSYSHIPFFSLCLVPDL